jgi:hypothetical protein
MVPESPEAQDAPAEELE